MSDEINNKIKNKNSNYTYHSLFPFLFLFTAIHLLTKRLLWFLSSFVYMDDFDDDDFDDDEDEEDDGDNSTFELWYVVVFLFNLSVLQDAEFETPPRLVSIPPRLRCVFRDAEFETPPRPVLVLVSVPSRPLRVLWDVEFETPPPPFRFPRKTNCLRSDLKSRQSSPTAPSPTLANTNTTTTCH